MMLDVLVLPGDGIGPEVITQAERVLERVASRWGHDLRVRTGLIGGAAIREPAVR
jgi:3-isopropylmalate dehydrogenase